MRIRALVITVIWLACSTAATAHLNLIRPRLLEIVERSDTILIAVIDAAAGAKTHARVVQVLAGGPLPEVVELRSPGQLRPGGRFLLFGRGREPVELVTTSGEIFDADPSDDVLLARLVTDLRAAAKMPGAARHERQLHALVDAVGAHGEAIRYHATIELDQLAGAASLSTAEQQQLQRAAAADPVIEPILTKVLVAGTHPAPAAATATPLSEQRKNAQE